MEQERIILRAVEEVRRPKVCPNGHLEQWCDECHKYVDPEWHDHADIDENIYQREGW